MLVIDLNSPEMTALFTRAPVYKKTAVVEAFLVKQVTDVVTILSNGFEETEVKAQPGQWIVYNPGGERYVLSPERFAARYTLVRDNQYQAKGLIRAFPNPTGQPVTIVAPWGTEQYGDERCFFAQTIDSEQEHRYLIEVTAFFETYTALDQT